MRRGFERYASPSGYDPGPLARNKLAELVVRKAGLFPGDRVLDVETGSGLLGVNVARAFTRSKVVVTESDRKRLLLARENARAESCADRVSFVHCLPDALPFKDEVSFFTTTGLSLASEEEPLDVLDEIHRVTGFFGKVYVAAADLRKLKKKPRGIAAWVFDEETIDALREIGYGKVQMQQVAVLADGGRLFLVTTKRFDPEGDGDEGEDEGEDAGEDEDDDR